MRILITGALGFTAKYLIPILSDRDGVELYFTDLCKRKGKSWYVCDLADSNSTMLLIKTIKPDQVFHLVGSFTNNYICDYESNVFTTKNLLDSILKIKPHCRILLIGSSAEYGKISNPAKPVSEKGPLNPVSLYGLTKVFQSHLMKFYFSIYKLDIVMARTFNLYGEGISNKLFAGRLYEQIDEYKIGRIKKIVLGNLEHKRDYIEITQAVKHYLAIMDYGISGEIYNVGSGKSMKTSKLLQVILKKSNIPKKAIGTHKTNTLNKIDISDICADITKLLRLKPTGERNEEN